MSKVDLLRGASDGMDRTLGEVGAKARRLTKVLHNGRAGEEIQPIRLEEGDHVIRVHRCTMPETTTRQVRKQPIGRSPLKQEV
jgi:hypothetical protein